MIHKLGNTKFVVRTTLLLLGAILTWILPTEDKNLILLAYPIFFLGVLIFHLIFVNYSVKARGLHIPFIQSLIDIVLGLIFLAPLLIFLDSQLSGDYDFVPQLIIFWVSYSLLIKLHLRKEVDWAIAIINGVNISIAISILWGISLYHFINVKNIKATNIAITSVFATFILTPVFAIKLFLYDRGQLKLGLITMGALLIGILILSNA
jgi:hypothetical protein